MIKPIETIYKGYRFRSRLEARWAVFFDSLDTPFEYEKEGYDLDGEWYLPDFYLPQVGFRGNTTNIGVWIEIKKLEDDQLENTHEDKYFKLAEHTHKPLILYHGTPGQHYESEYWGGYQYEEGPFWDNMMVFCRCYNDKCGFIKIEYMESNYMTCPVCRGVCDDDHPTIIKAINKAKSARFEFGEKG